MVSLKLGGSLITEKERARTARREVIARLADEIAASREARDEAILLGHGSGSYGHPPAARWRLREGLGAEGAVHGVALTQARAAELHGIVLEGLREAGVPAFSVSPSSAAVAEDGRLRSFPAEAVALALDRGLLPVVYGDVVMDRSRGVTICSTEEVLERLSEVLPEHGWQVDRALWMGDTEGVYDGRGRVLPELDAADPVPGAVGPARATDVTGGMAHRVEIALRMAARGIPSWIGDGLRPGALERALRGDPEGGTRIATGA
ncbi:MAG TPA: isopentenyl phosphate kinase [Longimicrobiales bacterium]|nr:isopentenyl phosphate kinase [Longimicrobiales bacterium]